MEKSNKDRTQNSALDFTIANIRNHDDIFVGFGVGACIALLFKLVCVITLM